MRIRRPGWDIDDDQICPKRRSGWSFNDDDIFLINFRRGWNVSTSDNDISRKAKGGGGTILCIDAYQK